MKRLIGLRVALAVFTAGMLGESLQFLFQGFSTTKGFFRVAGLEIGLSYVYVLIGMLLTAFFVVKDFSVIFDKNNVRKKWLIEKDQYLFCFYIILPYFLFVGGFYMFFHVFIQMVLAVTPRIPQNTQNDIISTFFSLFSILSICFLLTLTLFVVYFSNKVYGPVYAFKRYVRDVLLKGGPKEGPDRPFKLRTGDHFQDLSELAKELKLKPPLAGKTKGTSKKKE